MNDPIPGSKEFASLLEARGAEARAERAALEQAAAAAAAEHAAHMQERELAATAALQAADER